MKIFASGSCRLVTTINNGYNKVQPIHSMFMNFKGINFLGKLHNTKQHIQFIRFIKGEIEIPDDILSKFLTSYKGGGGCESSDLLTVKKDSIKNQFDECDWYIFEICSIKLYRNNGFEVQKELTNDFKHSQQSETELMEDLRMIRKMIPSHKNILFQVHFRPNIINDNNPSIDSREMIYKTVETFCKNREKTYLYDPSLLLKENNKLYDGNVHFHNSGHKASFNYIYEHFISRGTAARPT